MSKQLSIDDLWASVPSSDRAFDSTCIETLPEPARRYLAHAIAPGTALASTVRLRMHGKIKLRGWLPFTAEQVICWNRGMIWSAVVQMNGIPICGSDRLIDGEGSMRWKLLGILPMMTASGPDTTRSTIGRVQVESIWLPSALCHSDVIWAKTDSSHAHARFATQGEVAELDMALEDTGRVTTVSLPRWGNPEGTAFQYVNFGGVTEEEGTFDGYTIPTRIRVGWHFGTDLFEAKGEFFRAIIDQAIYQ